MEYRAKNKAAWEEAFDKRFPNWGDENHIRLKSEKLAFFDSDLKAELEQMSFEDKHVAQFCCNNGRELLSLVDFGAKSGVGFDFAENILEQAKDTAKRAGITNCSFVLTDILEIPESYHDQFDFILMTVGVIPWFADLASLFKKAADCLKSGGLLLINEAHPLCFMLPFAGEDCFDENNLDRLTYSYFRKEPWIETDGMEYLAGTYPSKPFTSYTHTMGSIFNALYAQGLKVIKLNEYDYDIGMGDAYDNRGYPLSYILIAEKEGGQGTVPCPPIAEKGKQ